MYVCIYNLILIIVIVIIIIIIVIIIVCHSWSCIARLRGNFLSYFRIYTSRYNCFFQVRQKM